MKFTFKHPLVPADHPVTGRPIVALLVMVNGVPVHFHGTSASEQEQEEAWAPHGLSADEAKALRQVNALLEEATDAALNEGCWKLQTGMGVEAGDFAGVYFSGDERIKPLARLLRDYAISEIGFSQSED